MLSMLASALVAAEVGREGDRRDRRCSNQVQVGTYNPLPKALHDCCDLREGSSSSGAGVMRRRRCVRNGEAVEASGVQSQPNSANAAVQARGKETST